MEAEDLGGGTEISTVGTSIIRGFLGGGPEEDDAVWEPDGAEVEELVAAASASLAALAAADLAAAPESLGGAFPDLESEGAATFEAGVLFARTVSDLVVVSGAGGAGSAVSLQNKGKESAIQENRKREKQATHESSFLLLPLREAIGSRKNGDGAC